jgi:tetratricopeptide (TPR) repeat protein
LNAAAALLCALSLSFSASEAGEEYLLAGASHFRESRYAEALVEFRVAEKHGARDAAAYAGACLVKLERWEEAIESFGPAETAGRNALLDYYRALACYGARLYVCADAALAGIQGRSGPKLAEQAAKIRAELAPKLAQPAAPAALAWYAARCAERRSAGRDVVADAYCREAEALSSRARGAGDTGARATLKSASSRGGSRP